MANPLSDNEAAIDFAPSSPLTTSKKVNSQVYKPKKHQKRKSPQTSPELGSPEVDHGRPEKRARHSSLPIAASPESSVQPQKQSGPSVVSSDDKDMSDIAATTAQADKKITEAPASEDQEAPAVAKDGDEGFWAIDEITAHRWNGDDIELEVHWEGGDVSWEPEANLQRDVPNLLFSYWAKAGGHPEHPDGSDMFTIFAVHKARKRGQELLVEWLGYKDKSWEPRSTVKEAAPELLEEFSSRKSVRGRPRKRQQKRQ
ncbi:chromo (CHRromatin organization MOdifier) domain-containing protein [Sarocladium implicatum]|nr:chromo (CHRromatin organization MOdifier) domain-containing protein [Sarocladium implicatum]